MTITMLPPGHPLENVRFVVIDEATNEILRWGVCARQDLTLQNLSPENPTGDGIGVYQRTDPFESCSGLAWNPETLTLYQPEG